MVLYRLEVLVGFLIVLLVRGIVLLMLLLELV